MEDPVHDSRGAYYQSSSRDRLLHGNTPTNGRVGGQSNSSTSTRRVWLVSILAAVGFLAVSTGTAKMYYAKGQASALASVARSGTTSAAQQVSNLGVTEDDHKGEDINPKDTYTCTGDYTLPVLKGVDLVAYHSLELDAPAVFGSETYQATYNGYLFWFSTQENLDLFEADPAKYMPAYGGFCSWAIAMEEQWQSYNLGPGPDLDLWAIGEDDGMLHLFRGKNPKDKFEDKFTANTKKGDYRWYSWFGTTEVGADGTGAPLDTFCFRDATW